MCFVSVLLKGQMRNSSESQVSHSLERSDPALQLIFLLFVASADAAHGGYFLRCFGVLGCAYLCRWTLAVGSVCARDEGHILTPFSVCSCQVQPELIFMLVLWLGDRVSYVGM